MNQKNTSFGLANMNGISDDSGRSCALSDMNCRKGQPEQSPSLQHISLLCRENQQKGGA